VPCATAERTTESLWNCCRPKFWPVSPDECDLGISFRASLYKYGACKSKLQIRNFLMRFNDSTWTTHTQTYVLLYTHNIQSRGSIARHPIPRSQFVYIVWSSCVHNHIVVGALSMMKTQPQLQQSNQVDRRLGVHHLFLELYLPVGRQRMTSRGPCWWQQTLLRTSFQLPTR
jgi:hypothetical protein